MMKKLTKVMAVAVSATMLCAAPVYAADTLTFGTNPEFPPFEFITSEGVIDTFDGIDMAIAKQIAEENDMEVKMESMEFDSLLVALQNGQVDAVIAGMTVTDERKEAVDFSTPYYTATQVMIVKEDSDIEKAEDMADKKICVIQGYTGETCVNEMGYDYEAFKKGTEAVMELVNGKCDVVVIDSATAKQYVDDNEGLKIVEDPDAFASEEYAIAVQKGNTELLDKINTAIDKMLEDGTISELAAQYAEEDMEEAVEEEAADGEADTEEATEEDTTEDAAEEDTAEEDTAEEDTAEEEADAE